MYSTFNFGFVYIRKVRTRPKHTVLVVSNVGPTVSLIATTGRFGNRFSFTDNLFISLLFALFFVFSLDTVIVGLLLEKIYQFECQSLVSKSNRFCQSCWSNFAHRQFEIYDLLTNFIEKTFYVYSCRYFIVFKSFSFSHTYDKFFNQREIKTCSSDRFFFWRFKVISIFFKSPSSDTVNLMTEESGSTSTLVFIFVFFLSFNPKIHL